MKTIKEYPSQETLRELFDYNDKEGRLYWKVRPANRVDTSKPAGSIKKDGYIRICIKGSKYQLHRLIYIWHFGKIEKDMVVDHICGNNTDNRINNLEAISHQRNISKQKGRSNNKSGYRGVYLDKKRSKWRVCVRVDNKSIHLGRFDNIENAAAVYDKAAIAYFGKHAQLNFFNDIFNPILQKYAA